MKTQLTLFCIVAATLGLYASAVASTVTSTADDLGPTTLRILIGAAAPGETIDFNLPSGSVITITRGEIAINKDLIVSGPGPTSLTIVGASPHDRVFEIEDHLDPNKNLVGSTVTILGLRLTGGYQSPDGAPGTEQSPNGHPPPAPATGGIILNDPDCTLTVSNCFMDGCYAIGGNGGPGFGGTLAPPGNGGAGADGRGAAIFTSGILTVYDCTFRSDVAAGGNGGDGTNASSSFNGSDGGPAGGGYGGALYVEYNGGVPAITAINCTFFDNLTRGGNGGAGGTGLPAAHGGVGGNGGPAEGGALYHASLNCLHGDCGSLVHCTVSQNHLLPGAGGPGGAGNISGNPGPDGSASGGGLFLRPEHFEIGSTIVAGDGPLGAAPCTGPDVKGKVDTLQFNLIGAADDSNGWNPVAPGLDYLGSAAFPLDPHLGPLQNNGGETLTMAPLAGSPAIDAGGPTIFTRDQILQLRPVTIAGVVNGGDGSDIGAYELQCSLDIPALTIAQSPINLRLTWPWPSRCFVLQQTSDLNAPNWTDCTYAINMVGNLNEVLISPLPQQPLFFRLKK